MGSVNDGTHTRSCSPGFHLSPEIKDSGTLKSLHQIISRVLSSSFLPPAAGRLVRVPLKPSGQSESQKFWKGDEKLAQREKNPPLYFSGYSKCLFHYGNSGSWRRVLLDLKLREQQADPNDDEEEDIKSSEGTEDQTYTQSK